MPLEKLRRSLAALGVTEGERIGVACSGGADSIALVHLLAEMSLYEVFVLHVDHRLRDDSFEDAAFVERVAGRLGLACHISVVNVQKRRRGSLEAAAREARYQALGDSARTLGLGSVATAHTVDDQAETVVLRMMRGGSLAGIAPRSGRFVRPLLDSTRAELRAWLKARGIAWREDPSNSDTRHERNWVRAEVLPALERRRAGITKVLARRAAAQRDDEDVLEGLAADILDRAAVDDVGLFLAADDFDPVPRAIRTRVVRSALRRLGVDPSWSDLDPVMRLRVGARASCGHVSVWRTRDGLALVGEPLAVPSDVAISPGSDVDLRDWGVRVRVGPSHRDPWRWRTSVPGPGGLIVRSRRPGDRVPTPLGTRKVQDVLVDAKVPRPVRDLVPIIATDQAALAVVGLTAFPQQSELVVDVEPNEPTWSRSETWKAAASS